jgi:hypothetical protein
VSFFGLFGKKNPVEKHSARVADKRAQAPDRWESIQALGKVIDDAKPKPPKKGAPPAPPTPEQLDLAKQAVNALLPRFGFYVDPSITDQEEKDEVARLIGDAGAPAIDPVLAFLGKSESLGWAIKLLDRLTTKDRLVAELLAMLAKMDTEYERDPIRKIQILQALEDRTDPRIPGAVARFVEDANETARFHAVGALFAQGEAAAEARAAMTAQLPKEESVRVRAKILEGFAERGWDVAVSTKEERAAMERRLPAGFTLDKNGVPRKKA